MHPRSDITFPPLAKWKIAALAAALAAAVFGLLYGAEFIQPNHPVFKSATQSLAALLLTSGIVSLIANALVRRELSSFWLKAIGIRDSISEAGLFDVGLDFQSYDFHSLIREAAKIDLCFIHAEKWVGSRLIDFKEFLSHRDRELRVCLLDENSACTGALSSDFGYSDGDLARKITTSVEGLRSCVDDLAKAGQSTGWLRIWK